MMQNKRKRPDLTLQERKRIITRLLDARVGGEGVFRLARGALTSTAKNFATCRQLFSSKTTTRQFISTTMTKIG